MGPGKQNYILTGNMSTVTKESVTLLVALISTTSQRIGEALGVLAPHKLRLMRPHHDLHVHSTIYMPITPSYQQGAIYVALVSAMVRRQCRPRTAIFGDVGTQGSLNRWVSHLPAVRCCLVPPDWSCLMWYHGCLCVGMRGHACERVWMCVCVVCVCASAWDFTSTAVNFCHSMGFRRIVLGEVSEGHMYLGLTHVCVHAVMGYLDNTDMEHIDRQTKGVVGHLPS